MEVQTKYKVFKDSKQRFVNVERIAEIQKALTSLNKELSLFPINHCKICGDTKPKNNYEALYSSSYPSLSISAITCNRCALSDENYERIYGGKKEIIKHNKTNGRK